VTKISGSPTKFALIGAAGFVAPRHMAAISAVGGDLVAACDLHDSVGVLDRYFPDAAFFQSPPAFFSYCKAAHVDYFVICTPNHRHIDHTLAALSCGADVLCEKPLVLSGAELSALSAMEKVTGQSVYSVLQLRSAPLVRALKESPPPDRASVVVNYVTRRGAWYHASWKGDRDRSGGVTANIGSHIFDLLTWVFGAHTTICLDSPPGARVRGALTLERADVKFALSVEGSDLPPGYAGYAHRILTINGETLSLDAGFTDLHTVVYQELLRGKGWTISDVREGIELVHAINELRPLAAGVVDLS
jgi:UDP-N-acetyl-2-amino-2-deoxyglucuronate dehydrogenase